MVRMLACWLGASAIALPLQSAPAPQDPAKTRRKQILDEINTYRKLAGVDAVVEKEALSQGCQLHAKYLNINKDKKEVQDGGAHEELKNLPGYSEEGAKSARRSVVTDHSSGIAGMMATVYHRPYLLNPCLVAVGIGEEENVLVIDVHDLDYAKRIATHPVIYPSSDQADVPLGFCAGGEWPDPRPDESAKAGFPITIQFLPIGWKPAESVVSLAEDKGNAVDGWLSSPEKPARADWPQPHLVCLIPKSELKAATKYTVTFKCKQIGVEKTPEWTKTWSFTTVAPKK